MPFENMKSGSFYVMKKLRDSQGVKWEILKRSYSDYGAAETAAKSEQRKNPQLTYRVGKCVAELSANVEVTVKGEQGESIPDPIGNGADAR